MKFLLPTAIVLSTGLVCCTSSTPTRTHDDLLADYSATMVEYNASLNTVIDLDTAKTARPRLEEISQKLVNLTEELDTLGNPEAEVMAKFEAEVQPTAERLAVNMIRLGQNQEILAEISDAMMTFMRARKKATGDGPTEGSSTK
jgi:hypothetical protein